MENTYQTKPLASAAFLSWGVVLLGAAFLLPQVAPALVEYPEDVRGLLVASAVAAALGLACLATGVYRFAAHTDRAAGVHRVERAPGPREARDDRD